ncbi:MULTISPECIES: histidine phosphatase family protein [unclassified Methylocaldum]|uniref:histidine phosphatase family protein n=1 Tax=unclassified Methylocaldum TaxID=2622260 RepID=UPI00098BC5AE|nr:alpha-ribazole phosphatase family protein [Methylocaldum sp. 14B]
MSDGVVHIDLLRHGETVGGTRFRGSLDDPLTDEGIRQMECAVANAGPWDEIVTSPLSRCAAFAASLAQRLSIPLEIDERLREIHFGDWEGRSYAELMATAPLALTRFLGDPLRHPPPGAESVEAFRERTLDALWDRLTAHNLGRRLLLVTHGGVIRVMLCHARQWPLARLLEIDVPHASLHSLCGSGQRCEEVRP